VEDHCGVGREDRTPNVDHVIFTPCKNRNSFYINREYGWLLCRVKVMRRQIEAGYARKEARDAGEEADLIEQIGHFLTTLQYIDRTKQQFLHRLPQAEQDT
jgi:hypothetical protein